MTKYVVIAAGVALLIASGLIWYLKEENATLTANLATEKANVEIAKNAISEQKKAIGRLEDQRKLDQIQLNALTGLMQTIQQDKEREIARYRKNEAQAERIIRKRPELLRRVYNRGYNRWMHDIFKATGGKVKADRDSKVSPAAAKPGNTTKDGAGVDTGNTKPRKAVGQ